MKLVWWLMIIQDHPKTWDPFAFPIHTSEILAEIPMVAG
jgi:hypothetical protein